MRNAVHPSLAFLYTLGKTIKIKLLYDLICMIKIMLKNVCNDL